MCWFVHTGSGLNIWCDPWIPSLPQFRPSVRLGVMLPRDLHYVRDLIDQQSGRWKEVEIRPYFYDQSATANLDIPLRPEGTHDVLKWTPDPKGIFSVKSAFHCTLGDMAFTSTQTFDWNRIWKLKMQHRLRLFIWKVLVDALPLRSSVFLPLLWGRCGNGFPLISGVSCESLCMAAWDLAYAGGVFCW